MEDKAFKQRKYYWKQKGFTEEEAIHLAAKKSSIKKIKESSGKRTKSFSVENVLLVCLSLALTTILIISATDYFGKDLMGYLKASALECGILGLVMYKSKSLLNAATKGLCLLAAVSLSVFTLHVGAKSNSHERNEAVADLDKSITILESTIALQKGSFDKLPENYATTQQKSLDSILSTNQNLLSLRAEKKALLLEDGVTGLTVKEITSSLTRIVFLLLNMFFSHVLMTKLSSSSVKSKIQSDSLTVTVRKNLHSLITKTEQYVLNPILVAMGGYPPKLSLWSQNSMKS